MRFDDLTDEQKTKASACKSPEDLLALAKEEGYELSDAELEGVTGGWGGCEDYKCSDDMASYCMTPYGR
ncbi:MAG: Nif11-like leader peptide family natural product precursor [Atopobiaceae bacterium]|nr:Nif11-like leader peptide family natural product precursor [Atopobiaceae bacterium]